MFAFAHHHDFTAAPGMWDSLLEAGPLFILLHGLLAASILVAVMVIARRAALPWMLLASCAPFIFASAAAHVGYIAKLLCLCGEFIPPGDVSGFLYPTRLFNWGGIISLALVFVSFLRPRFQRVAVIGKA